MRLMDLRAPVLALLLALSSCGDESDTGLLLTVTFDEQQAIDQLTVSAVVDDADGNTTKSTTVPETPAPQKSGMRVCCSCPTAGRG